MHAISGCDLRQLLPPSNPVFAHMNAFLVSKLFQTQKSVMVYFYNTVS